MEILKQQHDLPLMGIHVKSFPAGIKEAFDGLVDVFGLEREYYGISWMNEAGDIVYYAMTKETSPEVAQQYNYERLTIEKGDYKSETIHNWMSKTDSIKDVFHSLMGTQTPHKGDPCIEWYKSDDEMVCMLRSD